MNTHFEKRIVEAKDYNVRRYYIRLADGLCTKCGKKQDNFTTKCEACREKHSRYTLKAYRLKKGVPLDLPKQQGIKLCGNT